MKPRHIILAVFCIPMTVIYGAVNATETREVESIVVAGTGDSQSLMRRIERYLEDKMPDVRIAVPDSVGSSGGIKALARGKADLARVARPLKEKERTLNLTLRVFAKSPVVCVVHPSVVGVESLTAQEIVGIYSGAIDRWEQLGGAEGSIYPIAREPGDSTFSILGKHLPGFAAIETSRAKLVYTTPETLEILQGHEGTIGFLPLSVARGSSLRILAIDGLTASKETVETGAYPYIVPFGIVYRGELTGLARTFVEFLTSPECQDIIRKTGSLPVTASPRRTDKDAAKGQGS